MFKTGYSLGQKYGFIVLGFILILTLFIRFVGPVRDGDFFWHVEYGEYMVGNKTLIPDHTLYSWTPADNDEMYCAWIPEIFLYLMHRAGGLPLLFAFRYFCMFMLIFIVWLYAWKMDRGKDAFTYLMLLCILLCSNGAAYLKPEIFSMVFFAILAGIYFSVKASLWKKWGTKPFLFYPVIFLLWVNIHGVFTFGMVILGLITVGELVNYRFSRKSSLSKQGMRHLLTGSALSVAATFITPYGYKMILQFCNALLTLFSAGEDLGIKTVTAYRSSLSNEAFLYFWILMLISLSILLGWYFWKKRTIDWAILLPNLFLAFIYARYLRCAYYWPAFWGMSMIFLINGIHPYLPAKTRSGNVFRFGFILLFVWMSSRAFYESRYQSNLIQYFGFGVSYLNPVQASAFLKKYRPGNKLYNSYGIGGYLIYDLYPLYKVFCDPRYFPYQSWYAEYFNFNNGQTPLKKFIKKYDFDVAVVDYYSSQSPILKFLKSREWEPVFYGPAAIVFVRKDVEFNYSFKKSNKKRFDDLKCLSQAITVFFVAQNLGDLEASEHLIYIIKKKFSYMPQYEKEIQACELYQQGLMAFSKEDYEKALTVLEALGIRNDTPRVNYVLFKLKNWKAKQLIQKGNHEGAFNYCKSNLKYNPDYADGLYNAGVIGYHIEAIEKTKQKEKQAVTTNNFRFGHNTDVTNWRYYLERFLKLAPDHRHAWIARNLLEGKGLPPNVSLAL